MNKQDKRSRKTVNAIQQTVLKLLCTRPINEIRIVDLCMAADINRTTFYLHFASVGEVLASLQKEIIERVYATQELQVQFDQPSNPMPFLTCCTDILNSYEYFQEFVRTSVNADLFFAQLKDGFAHKLFKTFIDSDPDTSPEMLFVIRFLIAGVLDVYTEWLKTDHHTPLDVVLQKCAPIVQAGQTILADPAKNSERK